MLNAIWLQCILNSLAKCEHCSFCFWQMQSCMLVPSCVTVSCVKSLCCCRIIQKASFLKQLNMHIGTLALQLPQGSVCVHSKVGM